jgi:type III pantothenate kinase
VSVFLFGHHFEISTLSGMTMYLVVDVGNTHTVTGVYDDNTLIADWRMTSDRKHTADELAMRYNALFEMQKIPHKELHGIIISSVVPALQAAWLSCCRRYFSAHLRQDVIVVEVNQIKDLIHVDLDNPQEVGADRLVNSIAAWALNPVKQVVIDFGTAITFDCISDNCTYVGGTILPGIGISLDALSSRTARLPQIDISSPPENVIGRSTVEAMKSGILHGYGAMVDGMVHSIRMELCEPEDDFAVTATGGMAPLITPYSHCIERIEPMLTLNGLQEIYRRLAK